MSTDESKAGQREAAYRECVALVVEAASYRRAHLAAIREPTRPDRLPALDLTDWYERAEQVLAMLEETGGVP